MVFDYTNMKESGACRIYLVRAVYDTAVFTKSVHVGIIPKKPWFKLYKAICRRSRSKYTLCVSSFV